MRQRLLVLAAAGLAAAASAAGPAAAGSLTLAVDHSVRLGLAGPAGSVVVGNPAVADVTVVDSRTVFVSGRGPGSTDVTVIDPAGRIVFAGDVRVTSEAGAHVVVHRGATRADLSCDPSCVPSATPGASGQGPGSAAGNAAGGASNPLTGALVGAATGAIGGAIASSVGHTPS